MSEEKDLEFTAVHSATVRLGKELNRLRAAAVPVCVGQPLIRMLAKDGAWQSEDGRCVIAADDLHGNDPYTEIDRLRAENAELRQKILVAWELLEYQPGKISMETETATAVLANILAKTEKEEQ